MDVDGKSSVQLQHQQAPDKDGVDEESHLRDLVCQNDNAQHKEEYAVEDED